MSIKVRIGGNNVVVEDTTTGGFLIISVEIGGIPVIKQLVLNIEKQLATDLILSLEGESYLNLTRLSSFKLSGTVFLKEETLKDPILNNYSTPDPVIESIVEPVVVVEPVKPKPTKPKIEPLELTEEINLLGNLDQLDIKETPTPVKVEKPVKQGKVVETPKPVAIVGAKIKTPIGDDEMFIIPPSDLTTDPVKPTPPVKKKRKPRKQSQ